MSDYQLPGDGHGRHAIALEPTDNPRADRLAELIRTSAEAAIEKVRLRQRVALRAAGRGGKGPSNTRTPTLLDTRTDINRVLGLLEAWAVVTGNDGSQPGDPLRRASGRSLSAIARRHLKLDISEIVSF